MFLLYCWKLNTFTAWIITGGSTMRFSMVCVSALTGFAASMVGVLVLFAPHFGELWVLDGAPGSLGTVINSSAVGA